MVRIPAWCRSEARLNHVIDVTTRIEFDIDIFEATIRFVVHKHVHGYERRVPNEGSVKIRREEQLKPKTLCCR
jgi:hypothetical protein